MQDDEPVDPQLSRALDAWVALPPPPEFVDRVLAARDASAPPVQSRWRRRAVIAAALVAVAAATVVVLRPAHPAASGALHAERRTTAAIGDRGIAVAEPASELDWRVDAGGATEVVQRAGDVFYRVEPDGPFVVHTPAGDVRVTGTCFRVEVEDMKPNHKLVLSGLAGAAVASAVLLTVYEGHVIAETRSAKTELAAGTRATLRGDVTMVDAAAQGDDTASRAQLLSRTRAQQTELVALRTRLAQLDHAAPAVDTKAPGDDRRAAIAVNAGDDGGPWRDQSPEQLAAWVASCRIRTDAPDLEHGAPTPGSSVAPDEVDGFNAAMAETGRRWQDRVRALYLATTGDTASADTLSLESMRREIEDKSPPGELNVVLQRIARERAGLDQPPADLGKLSPLEQLMRANAALGDQAEAALAERIGAARASAIRGDGWGSRSEMAGCPGGGGK